MKRQHIELPERLGDEGVDLVRIDHRDLIDIDQHGLILLPGRTGRVLNIIDLVAKSVGTLYAQASSGALDGVAGHGDIADCLTAGNKCKKFAGFMVTNSGDALKLIALDGSGNPITAAKHSKLAKGRVKTVGVTDGGVDFINGQKVGYYTSGSDYFIANATVANGVVTALTNIDSSPSFFFEEAQASQLAGLKPVHKPADKATIQVATVDGSNYPLTFTIVGGGAGYVVGERLSLSDGTGSCIVSVASVNASGAITGLTLVSGTAAMTTAVDLTATGRTATDDTCTLTVTDLQEEAGHIDATIVFSLH